MSRFYAVFDFGLAPDLRHYDVDLDAAQRARLKLSAGPLAIARRGLSVAREVRSIYRSCGIRT